MSEPMKTTELYTELEGDGASRWPALVLMPFLGGSTRLWDELVAELGPGYRVLRVDLPGFGGSAGVPGYTVEAMAELVAAAIGAAGLADDGGQFVLVGHSMSAKVSLVLAARGLRGLAGLCLVAGSPPAPEPMTEEKRHGMLGLLGERHADDRARARSYVTKNESRDLSEALEERLATEVLRMNRTAWVAWLEHGSREDWAERVGVVHLPAVVLAGTKDEALGPAAQREWMMPHLASARLVEVEGSSHLIPVERPEVLADAIRELLESLPAGRPVVPPGYAGLIAGERVSEPTRAVLEARAAGPEPVPGKAIFTAEQERTLRALVECVVPQEGPSAIDLAGYLMANLAAGRGDGWRYDVLPEDKTAWREGLDRLAKKGFAEMEVDEQQRVLEKMAKDEGVEGRWFEDVRGETVSVYVAHPVTLARLGFSGVGVGGAFTPHRGFVTLGPNETESWEPRPEVVPKLEWPADQLLVDGGAQ